MIRIWFKTKINNFTIVLFEVMTVTIKWVHSVKEYDKLDSIKLGVCGEFCLCDIKNVTHCDMNIHIMAS